MRIKNLLLLTILFSISSFSWSQFTMMKVEGLKQGKFKSESTKAGSTDKTEVLGYAMEIKSPRDVASGQATGKRQHIP
ncbi:MAG: type VI secretion system tube protein Hcp, partial [Chitinophagaceae bacterium]|nr:type VI secretion system tube protein Hcp [Chitinophagaceae bacterium]